MERSRRLFARNLIEDTFFGSCRATRYSLQLLRNGVRFQSSSWRGRTPMFRQICGSSATSSYFRKRKPALMQTLLRTFATLHTRVSSGGGGGLVEDSSRPQRVARAVSLEAKRALVRIFETTKHACENFRRTKASVSAGRVFVGGLVRWAVLESLVGSCRNRRQFPRRANGTFPAR